MSQGFSEKTVQFLWGIRLNNERSWFEAHRDEYREVLEGPMRALAQAVYDGFAADHGKLDLGLHVARIYRDARRLFGRGPYRDQLWFSLRQSAEEWEDKPGFWFALGPEVWSYGMGYYRAKPLTMAKLRERIDRNPGPLLKLDRKLRGQTEFILEGEDYKKPKCAPDRPLAAWYNKKTFSLAHEEKVGEALFSPGLAERIIGGFSFLVPYFRYFTALGGDPAPQGAASRPGGKAL
jgi:uncharacterized protein (TIGR02453 family)